MKSDSDLSSKIRLHIRDGTSQRDRRPPALEQHYFELIDLRFHALMGMAVDYAEKMQFYGLNNRADGNWKSYFTADETVVIATILATDTGSWSSCSSSGSMLQNIVRKPSVRCRLYYRPRAETS